MKIYLEQIPEGVKPEDYPEGTEFVCIDDSRLERDPATNRLIPREHRPLIYPSDIKS